jgi:hypothetical protein
MRRHADHALMCLPMVLAAIVLVVLGAGALTILLAAICLVMMGAIIALTLRDDRGR